MVLVEPINSIPIVNEKGFMEQPLRLFFNNVATLAVLAGTGNPEGIIEALPSRLYMDEAGTAGSILYVKRDEDIGGDKTKGWILI